MFIKSSVSRHPFVAIILSVGSILIVHGITIIAHDYVNHTNPDQTILYAFDIGLENIEHAYAKMWGGTKLVQSYNHDLEERITEIEELLIKANKNEKQLIQNELFEFLTNSITTNARNSITTLQSVVEKNPDSLEISGLAIETDSLLQEINRRYEQIGVKIKSEANKQHFKEAGESLKAVINDLEPLLQALGVQETPKVIIQTQIEYRDIPAPSLDEANAATTQCLSAGQLCRSDNDCCQDQGYSCAIKRTTRDAEETRCLLL